MMVLVASGRWWATTTSQELVAFRAGHKTHHVQQQCQCPSVIVDSDEHPLDDDTLAPSVADGEVIRKSKPVAHLQLHAGEAL